MSKARSLAELRKRSSGGVEVGRGDARMPEEGQGQSLMHVRFEDPSSRIIHDGQSDVKGVGKGTTTSAGRSERKEDNSKWRRSSVVRREYELRSRYPGKMEGTGPR